MAKWKHLQRREFVQPRWQVERAFRDWPASNIGIVLGVATGIVGIDVDVAEGVDPEEGMAFLDRESRGDLGTPLTFSTSRGLRLLYAYDARITNCTIEGEGVKVDVLTTGKQTVVPPSVHPRGHVYQWLGGVELATLPTHLAPVPAWVIERCQREARTKKDVHTNFGRPMPGAKIVDGERNTTLFRMACAMRRWGMEQHEIGLVLSVVNERCVPPLDDREIEEIAAKVVARYTPYTA